MSDGCGTKQMESEVDSFNRSGGLFDINLEIERSAKTSLLQADSKHDDDVEDVEISKFNDNAFKQIQEGQHHSEEIFN